MSHETIFLKILNDSVTIVRKMYQVIRFSSYFLYFQHLTFGMTLHCISGKNYETTRSDFILNAHRKELIVLNMFKYNIVLWSHVICHLNHSSENPKMIQWQSWGKGIKWYDFCHFYIYIYFCNVFERGACASSLSRARPKIKHSQFFVGFLWNIIHYQKVWPDLQRLGTGTDVKVLRKTWDNIGATVFQTFFDPTK